MNEKRQKERKKKKKEILTISSAYRNCTNCFHVQAFYPAFYLSSFKERKITGETLKKKKGNDLSIASGVHIIVLGGSRDLKGFREPMKTSEDL